MTTIRLVVIAAALLVGAVILRGALEIRSLSARVDRFDRSCEATRIRLTQARRDLWGDAKNRRSGANDFQQFVDNDWREVNLCAPDPGWVGAGCATGDQACMIHTIDWALAVIR